MTNTKTKPAHDSDAHKGATETEENLSAQLPHRATTRQNEDLTGENGTDFPEPDAGPEHSGEKSKP